MKTIIPREIKYYCDICEEEIKPNFYHPIRDMYYFTLGDKTNKHGIPKKKFQWKECMCEACYKRFKRFVEKERSKEEDKT